MLKRNHVYTIHTWPVAVTPSHTNDIAWQTHSTERTVLLVAHNITTFSRLLDILPAFDSDSRIDLVCAATPDEPFRHGIDAMLATLGLRVLPWETAKTATFDLAIAASHHDGIHELTTPLVLISHGIGYTKYSPQEPGARSQEPGARSIFGLSPEWTLRDGAPFARSLVLSHPSQLARLTTAAPAAASSAYIAGDPCLDRITASLPFRERYRHALGIGDRTLVVVSSTWSDQSALGSRFELLRELLAELPRDSYAVAAVLHPNIRHHHGPGLIAHWYADCLRSGLIMLDEIDGWRAGLIAADVLIGDHGAVTGYGAAIGRPTVLAAFTDTPPGTAISELGDAAPRLPAHGPYRPIVDAMRGAEFSAADRIAGLATSEPGRSLELLRKLFYDLLALPVPPLAAIAALIPQPETISPTGSFADDVLVTPIAGCAGVDIERRPAEMRRFTDTNSDSHVCCHADYPVRTLRSHARVLVADRMDAGPDALGWLRSLLQANPLCELVALLSDTHLMALHRDGRRFQVDCAGCPGNAAASALYAIICAGTTPAAIAVRLGRDRFRILIEADE